MKFITQYLLAAVFALCATAATAVNPSDAGVVSSDQTSVQGFAAVYVPETAMTPESLVYYWFTYDENANQAWFITDPVPTGTRNVTVNLYKPISAFVSDEGEVGEPVGRLQFLGNYGDSILVQFGLNEIEGFTANCFVANGVLLPSPTPPELAGDWACSGRLMLDRVSPRVPGYDE